MLVKINCCHRQGGVQALQRPQPAVLPSFGREPCASLITEMPDSFGKLHPKVYTVHSYLKFWANVKWLL